MINLDFYKGGDETKQLRGDDRVIFYYTQK